MKEGIVGAKSMKQDRIIAALLGRGLVPADAAALGAFLHGLAGDLGAENLGRESLLASDIIAQLPGAFLALDAR